MYAAIVFLPLVGALLAGFFGKIIGDRGAHLVTCIFMAASMLRQRAEVLRILISGPSQRKPKEARMNYELLAMNTFLWGSLGKLLIKLTALDGV